MDDPGCDPGTQLRLTAEGSPCRHVERASAWDDMHSGGLSLHLGKDPTETSTVIGAGKGKERVDVVVSLHSLYPRPHVVSMLVGRVNLSR